MDFFDISSIRNRFRSRIQPVAFFRPEIKKARRVCLGGIFSFQDIVILIVFRVPEVESRLTYARFSG